MANLTLEQGQKLVYKGFRTYQKQGSQNVMRFVELGDPVNYETHTFIADKNLDLNNLSQFTPVVPTLAIGKFNNNLSLTLTALRIDSATK